MQQAEKDTCRMAGALFNRWFLCPAVSSFSEGYSSLIKKYCAQSWNTGLITKSC